MTTAGAVRVAAPRVNYQRVDPAMGERARFRSETLRLWSGDRPRCCRCYLHGLSTGGFVPALEEFPGSAAGLSGATITRLTTQ